jgi:hypothetical protein
MSQEQRAKKREPRGMQEARGKSKELRHNKRQDARDKNDEEKS